MAEHDGEPGGASGLDAGGPLLTMAEAIERLATTRATFNRWLKSGRVRGFKVGRQWRFRLADIEGFLGGPGAGFDLPVSPLPLIVALTEAVGETFEGEANLENLAGALIGAAIKRGARDLYADLLMRDGEREGVIRLRVDGMVFEIATYDVRLHQPLVDELKRRSGIDVRGGPRPDRGRMHIRLGQGRDIQMDTQVVPALNGDSLSARIMDPMAAQIPFEALGLAGSTLARLRAAIADKRGLVVVGGPAESGKQVTTYSLLRELDTRLLRLVTIEQPIQLALPDAVQIPLSDENGMDMSRALAATAELGADVLYVNPMDDAQAVAGCVNAGLGSLVVGSMHMDDAATGLCRMLDHGVRGPALVDTLGVVLAQRLVRRLCDECAKAGIPAGDDADAVARVCNEEGVSQADLGSNYRVAEGCEACRGTGYRGRIALYEALSVTPGVEALLSGGCPVEPDQLRRIAVAEGMETVAMDAMRKAAVGVTSLREVRRVADDLLRRY